MNPPTTDPQTVKLSASLYNLLLATYPTRFRQEYGPHMLQVFRDCCRKAYHTGGLPGMFWLWALTFFDYLQSVIEEHSQRGVHMNKEKFIRLSGWALILGALVFILTWAVSYIQEFNPYNALSRPVDKYLQYFYNSQVILMPTAMFLITLGILGLYLRYASTAGELGKYGLVAAGIGSLGTLSTIIFSVLVINTDVMWLVMMCGLLLTFAGIFAFGLAAVKTHFLPRWNFVPVLTGLGLPMLIVASLIYAGLAGGWMDIPFLEMLVFGFTGTGLFALGYMLQSDARVETQTAV